MKTALALAAAFVTLGLAAAKADILAQWNFDSLVLSTAYTNSPADGNINNIAADLGSGTASGHHATAVGGEYTTPAGNGSLNSLNARNWSVDDFFQFAVSTIGFQNVTLSFDQTSSSTGPRDFGVFYNVNGGSYSQFGLNYIVLQNGASPNPSWNVSTNLPAYSFSVDLSSLTALNNASSVSFRLVDRSTTSAGGGTVGAAGTDRVDNFTVLAAQIPEPSSAALAIFGGLVCLAALRRKF